jgi:plastocyanin
MLAACAALATIAGALPTAWAGQTAATTRVQVVEDEWRATPSRSRVRRGTLKLEVVNMGEDDHNLVIARAGGGTRRSTGVLRPDERETLTLSVRAGTYKLWCSIADHAERGMRSKIKVRS